MKTKELPNKISLGDKYGPAMEITDPAEATAYFEALVEHSMRCFGKSRGEAEVLERDNLGYFAGYYDHATRARVELLFNCAPSPEAAFEAGMQMATKGHA